MRSIPNQLGFPSAWMLFDLCVHVRSLILIRQFLSDVVIIAPHHFEEQVPQVHAVHHVQEVYVVFFFFSPCFLTQNDTWLYSHCIKIPAIGVDVVVDPRTPVPKRRKVFRLSFEPVYDHIICKHCSHTMPVFMLWEKTIFHILKPAERVDWEAAPMVALSAAAVPT